MQLLHSTIAVLTLPISEPRCPSNGSVNLVGKWSLRLSLIDSNHLIINSLFFIIELLCQCLVYMLFNNKMYTHCKIFIVSKSLQKILFFFFCHNFNIVNQPLLNMPHKQLCHKGYYCNIPQDCLLYILANVSYFVVQRYE